MNIPSPSLPFSEALLSTKPSLPSAYPTKSAGKVTVQVIYTITLDETALPSDENAEQFKLIISTTVATIIGEDMRVSVSDYWMERSRNNNLIFDIRVQNDIECNSSCESAVTSVNSTANAMKEKFIVAIDDDTFTSGLMEASVNANMTILNNVTVDSNSLQATNPEIFVSTSTPNYATILTPSMPPSIDSSTFLNKSPTTTPSQHLTRIPNLDQSSFPSQMLTKLPTMSPMKLST